MSTWWSTQISDKVLGMNKFVDDLQVYKDSDHSVRRPIKEIANIRSNYVIQCPRRQFMIK